MTFEREMRGLRPFRDRGFAVVFALVIEDPSSVMPLAMDSVERFLIGVGIPDWAGKRRGLLKMGPGRGDCVVSLIAGLLVIIPKAGFSCSFTLAAFSVTGFSPKAGGAAEARRAPLARELAVGASNLDEVEGRAESRDEEEAAVPTLDVLEALPTAFFSPRLPTPLPPVPVADTRAAESLVPTEDTLVAEILDLPVPATELKRLALLCKLFRPEPVPMLEDDARVDMVPKEGSGDLERERVEEAMEPAWVVEGTAGPFCFTTRTGGTRPPLPLALAFVGLAGATEDFLVDTRDGGPIFSFPFTSGSGLGAGAAVGLGIPLWTAVAGALPRFQTLWTSDFADERNPNFEGFGFCLAEKRNTILSK